VKENKKMVIFKKMSSSIENTVKLIPYNNILITFFNSESQIQHYDLSCVIF